VEYRRLHNHTASVAPGFEMRSKGIREDRVTYVPALWIL
jgi:hypothetical protein